MASPTRWTWVSVNSRSWWWTGRPGVLQFMGSQRVWHDWETELNWTGPSIRHPLNLIMGFPGGTVVKNLPANCKNPGSIPGSRRSPVVGNSNPLQYSCLENLHGQRSNWTYTHKPNNNNWPHASPFFKWFQSVKSLSHVQLFATLCWDCSTPGFPVYHQLLELAQTHVHCTGDAIQPSHPWSSPSPPAFSLSHHQGHFQWISSSHQMAKVVEFQLQHQSFQ